MNKKKKAGNFWEYIWAIIAGFLLVLTIGLIFSSDTSQKNIPDEKTEKKKQLDQINLQISNLELIRKNNKRREYFFFMWIRISISIGLLLIGLNILFSLYYNYKFSLGEQLNFNGAILLIYSFIAYILYGSLESFVRNLKLKIIKKALKSHLAVSYELEILYKTRTRIMNELK